MDIDVIDLFHEFPAKFVLCVCICLFAFFRRMLGIPLYRFPFSEDSWHSLASSGRVLSFLFAVLSYSSEKLYRRIKHAHTIEINQRMRNDFYALANERTHTVRIASKPLCVSFLVFFFLF